MFLMKKNMRFSIEFIFVVRFWVYRTMGGAITIPSFKGLDLDYSPLLEGSLAAELMVGTLRWRKEISYFR